MPIIYKLVGIKHASDSDPIRNEMLHPNWENDKDSINIQCVNELFISLGFSSNIVELKFITDSQTMTHDKDYPITEQDSRIIYVFTMSQELKDKLIKIFNEHGYVSVKKVTFEKEDSQNKSTEHATTPQVVDKELSKPIPEDEIKIDATVISASNLETLRLFGEHDFQTLLNVYVTNPDMFKIFASYVSSGTVVPTVFDKDNSIDYEEQFEEIKKLNIGANDEDINSALSEFNGHINLTLRYLLTVKSSDST